MPGGYDKTKSADLLKILKGGHPTTKWQNCGTQMLCVMLFYEGAELAIIVNKVLVNTVVVVYLYFEMCL